MNRRAGTATGPAPGVRLAPMGTLDDHIAAMLRESERNGELRAAPSFGKPMPQNAGWDETPEEFRLPFKILKDAGVVPPEVELMQQLGRLREELAGCAEGSPEQRALQQRASELHQFAMCALA